MYQLNKIINVLTGTFLNFRILLINGSFSSCQIMITNCTLDNDIIEKSTRYSRSFTIVSSKENFFINALRHTGINFVRYLFGKKKKADIITAFSTFIGICSSSTLAQSSRE